MSYSRMEYPIVPRTHVRERSSPTPLERSSRSSRSPQRARVPSPLKHAEFRPLAMEYANSPQQTSCKFYKHTLDEDEDTAPVGTPGGYCAAVRTVGYSTVGNKNFMSGKCPHCRRMVKSETQICTPNVTPPPSPWKMNLQSPLRSPVRTNPDDGQTSLQSPIRSPFKGSFFGAPMNDHDDNNRPTSPTPATTGRSGSTRSLRSNSPRPLSPGPRQQQQEQQQSPALSPGGPVRRSRSPGPRHLALSPGGGGSTRGPRSPGPRSPLRSPWKGSFFGGSNKDEEEMFNRQQQHQQQHQQPQAQSRRAHSPGPRSPLRVKVAFFDVADAAEIEEAMGVDSVAAAAKPKQSRGGWSPIRSPFKSSFFGGGAKDKRGGQVLVGTE